LINEYWASLSFQDLIEISKAQKCFLELFSNITVILENETHVQRKREIQRKREKELSVNLKKQSITNQSPYLANILSTVLTFNSFVQIQFIRNLRHHELASAVIASENLMT
jgi:hypothetical protein